MWEFIVFGQHFLPSFVERLLKAGKERYIPENVTTWIVLLRPMLSLSFLAVNIWLLSFFLVWKRWSNFLLLRPRSPRSVFWIPDVAEPLWTVVLSVPRICWLVVCKLEQKSFLALSFFCVKFASFIGHSIRPFSPSAVQLVYSWWELQGSVYFKN